MRIFEVAPEPLLDGPETPRYPRPSMRSARPICSNPGQRDFLGRGHELGLLRAAWDANARVITAWGPGGSGKTSLVRHFVSTLASRSEAPLEVHELSGAHDLRRACADLLSSTTPRRRSPKARRGPTISPVVLLIDGLDSLCAEAATLIREFLEADAPARFLITSREGLWLPEEERVEVGPLPLDDACELLLHEARAARGSRVDEWRGQHVIERIVAGVDALPLALRIAAAQLSVLAPHELEPRLSNQLDWTSLDTNHSRHRSLRAVMAQSWNALSSSEQSALRRLSVCDGSLAIEVAEQLLQSGAREQPLRVIERLRRYAMLRLDDRPRSGTRLRLYAATRLFAGEELRGAQQWASSLEAFAGATLRRVEQAAAGARARTDANAMARLREEEENGRSAYAWYRDRGPEKAGRVALALQELYRVHGPFPAQIDLLSEAVSALPEGAFSALRAQLTVARAELLRLCGQAAQAASDLSAVAIAADTDIVTRVEAQRLLGTVQRMMGNLNEALDSKRKALQMARDARLRSQEARCLGDLGTILVALGQLQEAARHHRAALDLHRREGDRAAEGIELSNLGVATHRLGHLQQARELHEQAVAIHREVGNRRSEAGDLCHLGFVLHQTGNLSEADDRFRNALRLCAELGDRQLAAVVKTWWGDLLTELRREAEATTILQEALGFHEAAADQRLQAIAHLHLAHAYRAGGRLPQAVDELETALSIAPAESTPVLALSHAWLARIIEGSGDAEAAAVHRRAAISLLDRLPNPLVETAVCLLVGQDQGNKRSNAVAQAASSCSDVRDALSATRQIPSEGRTLVIGTGVLWVALGTTRVELGRRKNLRLIVASLVDSRLQHPGEGLPWHKLVETGWPGEKMSVDAAQKRVYTAIWTLRKAGLDPVLTTTQDGYLIDPAVGITRQQDEAVAPSSRGGDCRPPRLHP